ncbi:unnamed protein product, partial [Ostreobium quekettii]
CNMSSATVPAGPEGSLQAPVPQSSVWLPGLAQAGASNTFDSSSLSPSTMRARTSMHRTSMTQHSRLYDVKSLPGISPSGSTGPRTGKRKQPAASRLPPIESSVETSSKEREDTSTRSTISTWQQSDSDKWPYPAGKRTRTSTQDGESKEGNDQGLDASSIANVKTIDDVIEFYGKYGQDGPIKFFYCNRADTGVLFRPYDLVVASSETLQPEYFTVSATGVMRIKEGVHAEFTPLYEFVRHKTIFGLLTIIRFFKCYLVGKFFRRWHKVRYADGMVDVGLGSHTHRIL